MEITLAAEFCKGNCHFRAHCRQCCEDRLSVIKLPSILASSESRDGFVANLGGKNDDT